MLCHLRIGILVLILSVPVYSANSQSLSDTLRLDDIIIEASRVAAPKKHQPIQVTIIDSVQLRISGVSRLSDILESHSGLFIRNYGPAGVSTISQRGMLAHQTQVLWNGFNINHPMLGLFDLNTFSAGMLSSIEINSAGSSAYGSGQMGGSIRLETDREKNGINLSHGIGSFGRFVTSAGLGHQGDNWAVNANAILDHSENDYRYANYTSNPVEKLKRTNSRVETQGILANGSYRFSSNKIRSAIWYSKSHRGVPGPIISPTRDARQEDEFIRWFGNYEHRIGLLKTNAKVYINRQELNFTDPVNNISSFSTHTSRVLELPIGYEFADYLQINGLVGIAGTTIESTAYYLGQSRQNYNVQLNPLIIPSERLRIFPAIRYDSYSDFGQAVSYALGVNYALIPQNLYWRVYVSNDFNAPTFNDLYWPQSGDPDLQPEVGRKIETGLYHSYSLEMFSQHNDVQLFISRLQDGIQWLPVSTGEFSPQNIREIKGHGFEIQSRSMFHPDRYQVTISQILNGTWSRYGKPRFQGDQAVGNQLVHTPVWQYKLSGILTRGPVSAMASHRWIGSRYTDEDNRNSLDAYAVVDIYLSFTHRFKTFSAEIQWNIYNLTNSVYEVIPYYPTPKRNHFLTVRFSI